MDDKNIDILLKQRTEEIKKQREEDENNPEVIPETEVVCAPNEEVKETIKTVGKVQKRSILWKLLALILLIGVNLLWMQNLNLNKNIKDLELEVISLLSGGESFTYMDQTMEKHDLLLLDNRTLINVDYVIDVIDNAVHYSNSGTRVYIPLENIDFQLETKEVTEYVKKNIVDINVPILVRNDVNYIDFDVMKKLYNLEIITALDGSFAIFNNNYTNLVIVDSNIEFVKTSHGMKVISDEEPTQVKAIVLDTHEDLSKIITASGRIGYVRTADLKTFNLDFVITSLNEIRPNHDYGENVNMTWTQISEYKNNPDLSIESSIPGLDAISPTWFSLNINGIVINEADFRYIYDAHEKNYEVWGLFSNSFKPGWTSDMLNDEVYRKKTIAQIAFYAAFYDLDGVNIDYENMYLADQDKFTQFIAELSSILREQNVTLSLAVTVPGGSDQWSKVYDRVNLAKHVDYLMLMAYDEFWASSPVSGPVASIPWVEKGIRETLDLVPNEKLILGIPLYMRVWIESGGSVSSKAFGIKHLPGILEEQTYESEYDDENFINYVSYRSDGKLHRVWVEDETSIEKRIALMNKYHLPGIGSWSREFVEMDTWEYINDILD